MRISRLISTLLPLGLLVATTSLQAQPREREDAGEREELREQLEGMRAVPVPEAGVRAGFDFETNDPSIGAQGYVPLGNVLRVMPSADVYFGDETTWQLNGDLAVSLLRLRIGAGVALVERARANGSSEIGYNLFLGFQRPRAAGVRVRPFVEARWTVLDDATRFQVMGGFNIALGGPIPAAP